MWRARVCVLIGVALCLAVVSQSTSVAQEDQTSPVQTPNVASEPRATHVQPESTKPPPGDYWASLYAFMLATFIGLGVISRVSRLLHTPLMSLTNAISAIAVVGSIIVAGSDFPLTIRLLGVVALCASMTNIVSGFLITDRMLRLFKQTGNEARP